MTTPGMAEDPSMTRSNHRLLLVDDEPKVVAGLMRVLRREPYEIVSAGSGTEALDLIACQPVDIVVTDYDMPGMKGTELLSHVARLHPHTVRFMLTGRPSLDIALRAINEGAVTRFFTKPADENDLIIGLRQAVQHRDLVLEALKLLQRYKAQQAVLDSLERENPGITNVQRDSDGIIDLGDWSPDAYDRLIEEMRRL